MTWKPPLPLRGPDEDGGYGEILVALDGSPFGESALGLALPTARAVGGRIRLVGVLDPFLTGGTSGMSQECRLQLAELENYLEGVRRSLRREGYGASVAVREGRPGAEIVAEARERDIGLVALAARPRREDDRLVSRGVAQDVIASGLASLLISRGDGGAGRGTFEGPPLRRVAVAVDGSGASHGALRLGAALASREGAELLLVQVIPPAEGESSAGSDPRRVARPRTFALADPSRARRYLDRLQGVVGGRGLAVRARLVRSRRVARAVEEAVREEEADLLVVGAQGCGQARGCYGRCSRRLLIRSRVPLLVVQDRPARAGRGTGKRLSRRPTRRLPWGGWGEPVREEPAPNGAAGDATLHPAAAPGGERSLQDGTET